MARKDDYGLPDETLQLIAAAPDLFAGGNYLQRGGNANTQLPGSALIAALRGDGTSNPGFSQYANRGNGESASARTVRRGLFAPSRLTMNRVTRDVTLPGAETQVPTRIPRIPQDPLVPDVPVAPPVDPVVPPTDPVTPVRRTSIASVIPDEIDPTTIPLIPAPDILETIPSIYTKPIVSDIPDEIDPKTIPLIPAPDILETVPSIYTKDIPSSIPDSVDPNSIPWITPEFPLDLPEIPDVPDRTGVVEMYPGDTVIPEPVGPRKGGGGDLPEDFDKYLVEIMNSLGGGGAGGGKAMFDESAANLAL